MAGDWQQVEQIIRRDPGSRGVASYTHNGEPLLPGHLQAAATDLARSVKAVAMVTGFAIITPDGVAAETDGPPGALYLARTFRELGIEVAVLSDAYGVPVLHAGCDAWGLPRATVQEIPFEDADPHHPDRQSNDEPHNARTDAWVGEFLASDFGRRLTHLIAIERVGPSHLHVAASLRDANASPGETPARESDFAAAVPPEHRNVCHNIRGESINRYTAKAHRLFEIVAERKLPITTIGIGDGGNEIGLGSIPWEVLRHAIAKGPADHVACRIATTWTILAGVSNWGGYALALATATLKERGSLGRLPDTAAVRTLIEALVRDSFCVDGVTKRRVPSVDGLALDDYLGTLESLRKPFISPTGKPE